MSPRALVRIGLFSTIIAACGDAPPRAVVPPPGMCMDTGGDAGAPVAAAAPPSSAPSAHVASEDAGAPATMPAWMSAALVSTAAYDVARSLADEVGPRLAGSEGDARAVAWAVRTMKAMGFENVHTEPVTVPVWKRGPESAEIVSPSHQPLAVTALGWSGSTPKGGVTAEVMEIDSLAELMKLPKDAAKGKIVFANVVMPRTNDGTGYGAAVPARAQGPTVATNAGAVAFVIRSVTPELDRFAHTGAAALRDQKSPIPAAAISTADADLLARTIAKSPSVKLHLVLQSEHAKDATSANVVGEMPGVEKKDEIILLGAHLDSWDLGRGALDDGAGVGIVTAAAQTVQMRARAAGRTGPGRTVRVVLFAAEENSVSGGKAYAAAHKNEAPSYVLAMEADAGTDRAMFARWVGDDSGKAAFASVVQGLAPLGITPNDGKGHAGTDVGFMVEAGVPSIDLRQDATHYFDVHHTAADTADKLDAAALAQVSAGFAHVVWEASDPRVAFGRAPLHKD